MKHVIGIIVLSVRIIIDMLHILIKYSFKFEFHVYTCYTKKNYLDRYFDLEITNTCI